MWSSTRCNGQLVQQLLRVSEVGGVEAFGKPGVDLGQHVSRVLMPALPLQQATQARRGSNFERVMTATSGRLDGAPKADLRFGRVDISLAQEQLPTPAMDLGCVHGFES